MLINDLFKKDIHRPINGVVKADQLDEASKWQELEEFVVTRELNRHFERFFQNYCAALDSAETPEIAERNGVWVSGFFGSGKSHFIKVLSYLLANEEHTYQGETHRAVEFFESKIKDAMLFGDIKRAVASNTDTILFNIDSKAERKAGREAVLGVFLKVLNEKQGFSGDHPHIAHMERHLAAKGQLQTFHEAYRGLTDTHWVDERDAYEFNRDEVIQALAKANGQSLESCGRWIDGAEENFALTVENFAKWVLTYLNSKSPHHRIIFLVDEVGQFIGKDTHLMLSLQTITEELGTLCRGRAWVVVTSQEDIDAALGELGSTKSNDFSKIQGRFRTRLSLSSANVDEVIQERLLAKTPDAQAELSRVFAQKGDVIKHQLTFKNVGMTFKKIQNAEDFIVNYPFAPYQFQLLQKIFESIRKAGATGLHLAQGERSLLDAFQNAAKAVASGKIGAAIPLYLFYPSIESFLDTAVKRTIHQARDNDSLEPFDAHLLEVLFLIRYPDEMKGNIDNLVTLCLEGIDSDRLALRHKIEASLSRLEGQTLISRSGENYFFLTHEERDINREIKSVELASGEDTRLLGELIFDGVLGELRKHRYAPNKMDFPINRLCDQHPVGRRSEGGLGVAVITPLADDYRQYQDSHCTLESTRDGGQILIRLDDHPDLGDELSTYLRTERYLKTKSDGTLPPTTKRIHSDLAEDNRHRRERLEHILGELMSAAQFFANGQKLKLSSNTIPKKALQEALDSLIANSFSKMGYLALLKENPLPEIRATLQSDDIGQGALESDLPVRNARAIADLREYLKLATGKSQQIILKELIENRYGRRPYGWPEFEVVLLLARLYAAGEIHFQRAGALLQRSEVFAAITERRQWSKITLHRRESTRPEDLQQARRLGKDLFAEMGPDNEESLYEFLHQKAENWQAQLQGYRAITETGKYPGREQIAQGIKLLRAVLAPDESNRFLRGFLERREDLLEFGEDFQDLRHFYSHQRNTWEILQRALGQFKLNQRELEGHEIAAAALREMQEILTHPKPYGLLHKTTNLIAQVDQINQAMLQERREQAHNILEKQIDDVISDLTAAGGAEPIRTACLSPLEGLRQEIASQESLAHLAQAETQGQQLRNQALARIENYLKKQAEQAEQAGQSAIAQPRVRPRREINPAQLVTTRYLKTPEEVEEFLRELRQQLEDALAANERIEIV